MKIGFTGPYCTANFGDWAMLVNNLVDFGLDNEYIVFTYSSSFPHNVIEYYFKDKNVTLIEVKTKEDEYPWKQSVPLECILSIDNKNEIINAVKSLDLLIVNGGGWIDDNWCKRLAKFYKVMAPVVIGTQWGIPIRFMAQGIGPIIETKETMRFFFNYLREDTVFAVRDNYCSASFLRELVHNKYKITYLPDDLAIINPMLMPNCTGKKIEGKYIVLVINEAVEIVQKNLNMYVEFCNSMWNKYHVRTVLLPFDLVWFGAEQSELIHKNVPESILIDIKDKKFVTIEDVVSVVSGAELLITERHHAAVVAMQTQTPFILKMDTGKQFYAYNKAYGVFKEYLENIVFDDSLFFRTNWDGLLNYIFEAYESIVQGQKAIFESREYSKNCDMLCEVRQTYIQSILKIV